MRSLTAALSAMLIAYLAGCERAPSPAPSTGGDAGRGAALIRQIGCGSCHRIPGIADAIGDVGPPLDRIGRRTFIAGVLANTPDNLIAWIRTPQSVVPGNAMPNMELDDDDARDIAAYLYTLR